VKHKRWFHALLFLSIVVLTTPALALGPPRPTTAGPASLASPAGILLNEGFEDGVMPPPGGWSTTQSHPSYNWAVADYASWIHSGSFAARVDWDAGTASDEWLLSPVIDLTDVPDALLDFWALSVTFWCPNNGSGADVFLHVTEPGGTFIDTVWNMCSESWETWEYRLVSVDLSPFQGEQVRLAWQYVGIDGISFLLDDISLTRFSGGYVDGYITDFNMSLPLVNANVCLSGITDPGFEDTTWSNAEGYYVFGPLLAGD
jgi:hypothetical protein